MDKAKAERARNVSTKKFHVLGSTDAVNTCDCCGKTGLKATWQIEMIDTGERFFYGSVCVTHNTARKLGALKKMQDEYEAERLQAALKEYRATPEYRAYQVKHAEALRLNISPGKEFREFTRAECDADREVCRQIAERYNVPLYRLH